MFSNSKKLLIELSLVLLSTFIGLNIFAQNDTTPPNVAIKNNSGNDNIIYKLTSDEALSYLKIELNKNLYAVLYKGFYGTSKDLKWHAAVEKDGGSLHFVDIFENENVFSLKYAGSEAKVSLSKEETEFDLEIFGPIAKQIKARKDFLVYVKDFAQNETSFNFNNDSLSSIKHGFFNKSFVDHPIRAVNLNTNYQGWATSLTANKEDKLKFCVYYHNSSDIISKNTKVYLTLDNNKVKSILASDNFNNYESTLDINQNIELDNVAKWYHNYKGSYKIEEVEIEITKDGAVIFLGDIKPGYSPNDGYVVFTGTAK